MMKPSDDRSKMERDIDKLLQNLPLGKLWDSKRREFISRLYKIQEERKTIIDYIPVRETRVLVGVFATLLLVFISYNMFFAPLYPNISNIEGTVKVYRANKNEWMLADKKGLKLGKNDILKTFEASQADIVLGKKYHVRLKDNTEIKLASASPRFLRGKNTYDITKGKVFTYYNKAKRGIFDIETPEAVATCVGTDFMVSVIPKLSTTWVGVLDGKVRVRGRDIEDPSKFKEDTVLVEPGKKTVIKKGSVPDKPARLLQDELLELEELYRIGRKPQVALLISTSSTRVRELLSLTPLFISSGEIDLSDKVVDIAKLFNQAIKEGSEEKHKESIRQFENILEEKPNPKYDVQFLLFIGAYYQYLDQYEKAIETFERVIRDYPTSSLASIAQCAIGIIYEEKLKDKEKAREAYEKVINNYPQSPEREEAETGLKRLKA